MSVSDREIEECVLRLLRSRAQTASICPSDVARALLPHEWRGLMPSVRQVAARLAREGIVRITQGSATLNPDRIDRGPIRLRRGAAFPPSA